MVSSDFSLPWYRCYTLNIDDLETAVARAFELPRPIIATSATALRPTANPPGTDWHLHVVHLNGTLADIPDDVTFSNSQYAERLSRQEPVYVQLVADLMSHPFVFIGTKLDEPPLWQHVQLRATRGGRKIQELRPHSFLVTPTLDKAREAVLRQYNLSWIPAGGKEFTETTLQRLGAAAQEGFKYFQPSTRRTRAIWRVPEVSDLAKVPAHKTEFLLGTEPVWTDVQTGRAITRESDGEVAAVVNEALGRPGLKGLIIFSGTAGAGKSTALMRAALTLSNRGLRVGWIDHDTDASSRDISGAYIQSNFPDVLAIDDADRYGSELASLAREITGGGSRTLMMVGLRSGKVDTFLKSSSLAKIPVREVVMPPLADSDIDLLLDALETENRLGALKKLLPGERRQVFSDKAGRQLLVAMIEATSGQRFEEKAFGEFDEMEAAAKRIYALIAACTALGFNLTKNELLIGLGVATNEALDTLARLAERHIVEHVPGSLNSFRARHRVIAEIIFNKLQKDGQLYETLIGLAFASATQLAMESRPNSRPARLLVRILNHDFLHRSFGMTQARQFFDELEPVLKGDHHFWLQRGSLELEDGYLPRAQNFLDQAQAIRPDDPLVACTYSHLLFRKSLSNPGSLDAPTLVQQAVVQLKADIIKRGDKNHHAYHILGSQWLAWCRKGVTSFDEKKATLEELQTIVGEGAVRHGRAELKTLNAAIRDEYLNLALRA